eukprot:scaffold24322_cov81-Phaeocystis_antarctica.AAC.5
MRAAGAAAAVAAAAAAAAAAARSTSQLISQTRVFASRRAAYICETSASVKPRRARRRWKSFQGLGLGLAAGLAVLAAAVAAAALVALVALVAARGFFFGVRGGGALALGLALGLAVGWASGDGGGADSGTSGGVGGVLLARAAVSSSWGSPESETSSTRTISADQSHGATG